MGTPKKVPLILGNPHIAFLFFARLTAPEGHLQPPSRRLQGPRACKRICCLCSMLQNSLFAKLSQSDCSRATLGPQKPVSSKCSSEAREQRMLLFLALQLTQDVTRHAALPSVPARVRLWPHASLLFANPAIADRPLEAEGLRFHTARASANCRRHHSLRICLRSCTMRCGCSLRVAERDPVSPLPSKNVGFRGSYIGPQTTRIEFRV